MADRLTSYSLPRRPKDMPAPIEERRDLLRIVVTQSFEDRARSRIQFSDHTVGGGPVRTKGEFVALGNRDRQEERRPNRAPR
jgi:hypothetical protein